jgi:F0F1-type ATP synthase assembly protein I
MNGNGSSREQLTRRGAAAYQGALEAVLAIVIGAGLGYWLDGRYGTSPRWLIVGTALGFGAFVLRLWRMRKLVEGPPPGGTAGGGG